MRGLQTLEASPRETGFCEGWVLRNGADFDGAASRMAQMLHGVNEGVLSPRAARRMLCSQPEYMRRRTPGRIPPRDRQAMGPALELPERRALVT